MCSYPLVPFSGRRIRHKLWSVRYELDEENTPLETEPLADSETEELSKPGLDKSTWRKTPNGRWSLFNWGKSRDGDENKEEDDDDEEGKVKRKPAKKGKASDESSEGSDGAASDESDDSQEMMTFHRFLEAKRELRKAKKAAKEQAKAGAEAVAVVVEAPKPKAEVRETVHENMPCICVVVVLGSSHDCKTSLALSSMLL